MAFEFTPKMAKTSNQLWAVTSAVGSGLCFLTLLSFVAVWAHPKSRLHLDRVSFRIVCYALVTNTIFGIANTVGGVLSSPSFGCGFSIWVLQLTLQLSSFLLFCIALNLLLVIVYKVNGRRMEKFYVMGSCALALTVTIPPYASGQYGWDVLAQDCWYTNDNQKQRLAWQISTQMAWTGLTVVGKIIISLLVVGFMINHQRRMRSVFGVASTASDIGKGTGASSQPSVMVAHSNRRIILRIALYPLTDCVINSLSIFCVIYNTANVGIHSWENYNVLLLSDFLYGGRPVAYGILAVTDPAFIKGLRVLIFHLRYGPNAEYESKSSKKSLTPSRPKLEVNIQLSTYQDHSPAYLPPSTKKGLEWSDNAMETGHRLSHPYGLKRDGFGDGKEVVDIRNLDVERPQVTEIEARPSVLRRSTRATSPNDMRTDEELAFKRQI